MTGNNELQTEKQSRLSTHHLVKTFGNRTVVQDVCVEVGQGEVVGILGPNGAGKSTTFNMVVGLLRPTAGSVALDGQDITALPMHRRARLGLSYLPQEKSVFQRMTVEQNILAILETQALSARDRKNRVDEVLEELGVTHVRKSMAYTLSGGERRRVEIARALVTNPTFMLLDEPFAGVDPRVVEQLQDIIRQLKNRNLGVLITDHNARELLSVSDRSYIIYSGKVMMSGTTSQLVASPEARKYYLGERFYFDGAAGTVTSELGE
jgi:lipopolysaccharide export system ATP-binding protein